MEKGSHQPQWKPEATVVKVNVETAIQFETGVAFQRLCVKTLERPQLTIFEPCCFLLYSQPHHDTQSSSNSIFDFFPVLEAVQTQWGIFLLTLPVWGTEIILVDPCTAASSSSVLCITEPALNIAFLPFLRGPSLLVFSCCLGHLVQAAAILKKGTVCFCLWKS